MTKPKYTGNILILGTFSQKFLDKITNSEAVSFCDHLQLPPKTGKGDKRKQQKEIVNIKTLRKKYRNKFFNTIIINYEEIAKFDKHWVADSVFLCRDKIYVYNYNERVLKKYQRYNVNCRAKKHLEIIVGDVKPGFFARKKHYLQDSLEQLFDYISDFLTM